MVRTTEFFDRLLERFDQLDPSSVQGYLLRLVRERGLLETIFQTIREGVLIIDRDLNIHYVNNAAMTLLGLPADIRERSEPRINRYLRDLDWEQIMSQDPGSWERASRQEIEVMYPEHRHLQFYLLPYNTETGRDGRLDLVAIVMRDITELREKAESTIESEKLNAITMLAAGVAHEIGNPLNSLMIHLQLLQRSFRRPGSEESREEALDMLQVAVDEVNRLDSIINQFLRAIRPTPLDLKPLTLSELVEETLSILKLEIGDRGIQVECEWSERLPTVMGDDNQLKQAFYNIVNNAIQAMPDGGLLRIIIEVCEDVQRVRFIDTGKGIEASEMGNIFNAYYTTKSQGTGLGLVIVERIMREHGGTVSVESEVEQGTEFCLRFPLHVKRTKLLDYRPPEDENGGASPTTSPQD